MQLQYQYKVVSKLAPEALEKANELGEAGWKVVSFERKLVGEQELYYIFLLEKSSEMVEKPAQYHLPCCRHDHDYEHDPDGLH